METKPLLFGLIGFFVGGFLVSVAATTFDKPDAPSHTTMSGMIRMLEGLRGEKYDAAFVEYMIEHHEAAVDMAKLSDGRAARQEVKDLSQQIISSQTDEIQTMKEWRHEWSGSNHGSSVQH